MSSFSINFSSEKYPNTEAAFKDMVSTFLVFSKKGRKYLRDVQYTGNLLVDFNITVSACAGREPSSVVRRAE